jgi:structural maintenance of chromosome 2
LLNEEITPTVQKLKAERTTYLEFQKVQRELDHLTKVYLAYQFMCAEETAKQSAHNLEEVNEKVVAIQDTIKGDLNNGPLINRIFTFLICSCPDN